MQPISDDEVYAALKRSTSLIARGNGRGYGDAALNPNGTLLTRRLNRVLEFDRRTGVLVCEAGTLLSDVLRTFVGRGWFVPVTPGTKFVTVGGMVAADVHGKNHPQAGSIARHVAWIDVMIGDGSIVRCSVTENAKLFEATLGGIGLTGIILRVALKLAPIETSTIVQRTIRAANFQEAIEVFESNYEATYTVAWIDCMARGRRFGRSVVKLGKHARNAELSAAVKEAGRLQSRSVGIPVDLPPFIFNHWTVAVLNELYHRRAGPGSKLVSMDQYFYPLDAVRGWNRIYGRRGFVQYQFVLPQDAALRGMSDVLDRIAKHRANPFLAVVKRFGSGRGMMSFPIQGYTMALDFSASAEVFDLLATLDFVVADYGGRVYLAKDVRTDKSSVARGYPGLDEFRAVRERVDPNRRFTSLLSMRLGL